MEGEVPDQARETAVDPEANQEEEPFKDEKDPMAIIEDTATKQDSNNYGSLENQAEAP